MIFLSQLQLNFAFFQMYQENILPTKISWNPTKMEQPLELSTVGSTKPPEPSFEKLKGCGVVTHPNGHEVRLLGNIQNLVDKFNEEDGTSF